MKIFFAALLIGLFFSCTNIVEKKEKNISANFKSKDTIISCSGYWLCKDYFERINNLKSPKKAQENSELIFLPERTWMPTMMISNFHEGGPTLTVLNNGNQYELWEIQEDSLIQRIEKITIMDSVNIKIGKRSFVKINPLKSDYGFRILEEILFKGSYSNASGTIVEFKKNGQVVGLDNFKVYEPVIDYIDAGRQVDLIRLGTSKKEIEYFGFIFNHDTLELYKLNCLAYDSIEKRCVEVELGQLTHKLWRRK